MEDSTFRTKTGICRVTDTQVIVSRSGTRGWLARVVVGSSITRILAIYTMLSLSALAFAAWLITLGQYLPTVLLVAVSLVLLRGVIRSRAFSATPVIEREEITSVESHPPKSGAVRGHLIIHFRREDRDLKRIIILPGVLENGGSEYERASRILEQMTSGLNRTRLVGSASDRPV